MRFTQTALPGVVVIDIERREDERGFFARSWCREELQAHGLNPRLVQCSVSLTRRRGMVRGLHYQVTPHEEAKVVRCGRGAIYDVVLDLRGSGPTFGQWVAVELRAEDYRMVYVPEGCAHGFQTLEDETEVVYQMSESYHPESARGIRWNDPAFHMSWPLELTTISAKDGAYPLFQQVRR